LTLIQVIAPYRDSGSPGGVHPFRGLLDALRTVHLAAICTGTAPGDKDVGAQRTEFHRDRATASPGRPGHHGNLACKRKCHDGFIPSQDFTHSSALVSRELGLGPIADADSEAAIASRPAANAASAAAR